MADKKQENINYENYDLEFSSDFKHFLFKDIYQYNSNSIDEPTIRKYYLDGVSVTNVNDYVISFQDAAQKNEKKLDETRINVYQGQLVFRKEDESKKFGILNERTIDDYDTFIQKAFNLLSQKTLTNSEIFYLLNNYLYPRDVSFNVNIPTSTRPEKLDIMLEFTINGE